MQDVKQKVIEDLKKIVKELTNQDITPNLEHPKEDRHGRVTLRYKDKTIPYKVIQQEVKQVRLPQVVSAKSFQESSVATKISACWMKIREID